MKPLKDTRPQMGAFQDQAEASRIEVNLSLLGGWKLGVERAESSVNKPTAWAFAVGQ